MKDIISMLIEKDLLVVVILGIIIILFLILFVVLLITDKNKNKKQEKTIDEEDKIEILNISKPTQEDIISKEEIKENEMIESEEIDEDLELETQENEENISDIADVLASMQAYLDERNQKVIDSFEQEQEENAIISYQELVKACKKNKENEIVTEIKEKEEVKKQEPVKKFKNSEFISPIYGKEKKKEDSLDQFLNKKEELSYSKEINSPIESEFDLEELQKEMRENEDFLEELKNFRNSL